MTKTKLDYQHSEDGVERLKKKVADAEKEKVALVLLRIGLTGASARHLELWKLL